MGIRSWFREQRRWRSDHHSAWSPLRQVLPSGVNAFQDRCERELLALLATRGLSLRERGLVGGTEPSITGRVGFPGVTVWIHPDTVEAYAGPSCLVRVEEWDTRTPDELLREYFARLSAALPGGAATSNE